MPNYTHYRRVGSTGGLIIDTLSDASGPKDLSGWTEMEIIALHPDSDAEKFRQAITPDPDQTANTGKITYQPVTTDIDTAGTFRFFYHGKDPSGQPWIFPTDDPEGDRAYGELIVY